VLRAHDIAPAGAIIARRPPIVAGAITPYGRRVGAGPVLTVAMSFASDLLFPADTRVVEMLAMTYGHDENMEGIRVWLAKRKPDSRTYRKRAAGATS
jgi:hypothetical protein